ncbi:MAG: LemA family protein [Betaproteobacteria bacterium]|nr:LemA family protein [Betaproteobacteria bacterium]
MSWVILAVLAAIVFWAISAYNQLVALRNRFRNAYAQIDVQLKRRYDLIPNLVDVAKAYLKHERETLEAVIAARNSALGASRAVAAKPGDAAAMQGLATAEGALQGALGRLFALAEAYPDLQSNQNMMQLSEELTSTENKVAFARQAFNDAVMEYNTGTEQFPASVLAGLFRFEAAQLLQATESAEERKAIRVQF